MKKVKSVRGDNSSSTKGRKPSVASLLEANAKANISEKISYLLLAIKAGNSDLGDLEIGLPTTRRQFNMWSPLDASGTRLHRNADETLKRHPQLLTTVEDAVAAVKTLKVRTTRSDRPTRLADARRAQKIHWKLRVICERMLLTTRRELSGLREQLVIAHAVQKSAAEEFNRVVANLQNELDSLRAENARLIRCATNVVSLVPKK